MVLREDGGGTADAPEVKPAVLLARVGHLFAAVAFRQHDERATVRLKQIDVAIHAAGGGRAKRAGGVADWGLGRTGVVDGVVFDVIGQALARVDAFLEFCVRAVAGDDHGARQEDAGGHRIVRKRGADFRHRAGEVDGDGGLVLERAQGLRNETARIHFQLLQEDAVLRDLGLNVAVGTARYAHADGATGTVAGQAHDADVEGEILTTELRADFRLLGDREHLGLHLEVAKSAAVLVPGRG